MSSSDAELEKRVAQEIERLGASAKGLWSEKAHAAYRGCSVSLCQKERHLGTGPEYLKIQHLVRYHPEAVIRFCFERRINSLMKNSGSTPKHPLKIKGEEV